MTDRKTDFKGKLLLRILMMLSVFPLISCTEEQISEENDTDKEQEKPAPEKPSPDVPADIPEGKVRLYLTDASIRNFYGSAVSDWSSCTITVGGADYEVGTDDAGKAYVDVPVTEDAVSYDALAMFDDTEDYYRDGLVHPFAYAGHQISRTVENFPLHASVHTEDRTGELKFRTGRSVIRLNVKGNCSVASIRLQSPSNSLIAGIGAYTADGIALERGTDFVVLNTTDRGNFVQVDDAGVGFLIPVVPGTYADGLDVTICSSDHKMSKSRISSFAIAQDEIHSAEVVWTPDADLLFYEGFDNFVWGGDIVGGSDTFGMLPKAETVTATSFRTLTGYETPLYMAAYDMAGAGYIQKSSRISDIDGKTVAESRNMSDSYIKSRNVGMYNALFRCQEHQGYISVGTSEQYNGIFEPAFAGGVIDFHKDVTVSFDFCPKSDFDDDLMFTATSGANITECSVDGVVLDATAFSRQFSKTGSTAKILRSAVTIPADMTAAKHWHRISLTVRNMGDASSFDVSTASSHTRIGSYGFYIDNFEVRTIYDTGKKKSSTLRVLYWNIQNGMWADQDKNYNNFVAWVKKYNPDVCVWCEGETIFNKSGDKVYGTSRTLPGAWSSVAGRYGHQYVEKGADVDNYPQIITSKYPISKLEEFHQIDETSDNVEHGSGLFEVNFNGSIIYFVPFHAFAHAYDPKYTGSSAAEQEASSAKFEGDLHREKEISYICRQTVGDSRYSVQKNWLMMGDFNAVSSLDKEHYTGQNETVWLLHDYILNNTDLKDVIAERNAPGDYFSSINGDSRRIDFIYASPQMYDRIASAAIIIDSWTSLTQDKSVSDKGYFCIPSDHRPILVDFKMN